MPTSARLFVYEDLRETMTTKKERNSHDSPVREKNKRRYSYITCYFICFLKKNKKKITCCQNNFTFFSFKFESVYLVLGSVYRFRSSSSLRPHPQIEDDDRRGDVHSKFGATQFGCQSAHLLPIFYTSLSQSQVNTLLRCKVEMNSKK